jgi:hypothetical protein
MVDVDTAAAAAAAAAVDGGSSLAEASVQRNLIQNDSKSDWRQTERNVVTVPKYIMCVYVK